MCVEYNEYRCKNKRLFLMKSYFSYILSYFLPPNDIDVARNDARDHSSIIIK